MQIIATCSRCGKRYRLDESVAGRKVQCASCKNVFIVAGDAMPVSVADAIYSAHTAAAESAPPDAPPLDAHPEPPALALSGPRRPSLRTPAEWSLPPGVQKAIDACLPPVAIVLLLVAWGAGLIHTKFAAESVSRVLVQAVVFAATVWLAVLSLSRAMTLTGATMPSRPYFRMCAPMALALAVCNFASGFVETGDMSAGKMALAVGIALAATWLLFRLNGMGMLMAWLAVVIWVVVGSVLVLVGVGMVEVMFFGGDTRELKLPDGFVLKIDLDNPPGDAKAIRRKINNSIAERLAETGLAPQSGNPITIDVSIRRTGSEQVGLGRAGQDPSEYVAADKLRLQVKLVDGSGKVISDRGTDISNTDLVLEVKSGQSSSQAWNQKAWDRAATFAGMMLPGIKGQPGVAQQPVNPPAPGPAKLAEGITLEIQLNGAPIPPENLAAVHEEVATALRKRMQTQGLLVPRPNAPVTIWFKVSRTGKTERVPAPPDAASTAPLDLDILQVELHFASSKFVLFWHQDRQVMPSVALRGAPDEIRRVAREGRPGWTETDAQNTIVWFAAVNQIGVLPLPAALE